MGRAGQLLTQMIENTSSKEGIPITALGRLYLQRGEVPSAGESDAVAGRDGDVRPIPVSAVDGNSAEGDLRPGRHGDEGAAEHEGGNHEVARASGTSGETFPSWSLITRLICCGNTTRRRNARLGKI